MEQYEDGKEQYRGGSKEIEADARKGYDTSGERKHYDAAGRTGFDR